VRVEADTDFSGQCSEYFKACLKKERSPPTPIQNLITQDFTIIYPKHIEGIQFVKIKKYNYD
jgi:hypothetical protein